MECSLSAQVERRARIGSRQGSRDGMEWAPAVWCEGGWSYKGPCHDLRVVCFSTALGILRRLNEQEWMLPCDSPSKVAWWWLRSEVAWCPSVVWVKNVVCSERESSKAIQKTTLRSSTIFTFRTAIAKLSLGA